MDKAENETIPRQEYEIRSLRDQLVSEQSMTTNLKTDVRQLTEESKQYQDDLNQIRTSLSSRITERDEEIEKLRKQLVFKQQRASSASSSSGSQMSSSNSGHGSGSASVEEWEQRLKTLTDNLISKQASVEQVSSDNHSLKLHLLKIIYFVYFKNSCYWNLSLANLYQLYQTSNDFESNGRIDVTPS